METRPPNEPSPIQKEILNLQARRPPGSGMARKAGFGAVAVAVILAIGAYLGRYLHGLGSGAGSATTGVLQIDQKPAPPPAPEWVPKRPLVIDIDGMQYKVDGKVVDMPTILQMVKRIPPGDGQAVDISPEGTSKPLAERALKDALNQAKVTYTGLPE